jgi:hypothetical protein
MGYWDTKINGPKTIPTNIGGCYDGRLIDAELVFAIVCPLGTPYKRVVEALGNYLGHFGPTAAVRSQVKPSTYLQRELLPSDALKGILSSHG